MAGYVLASTNELKVATGIANVYARDAVAAAAGARTLTEFSGGRFILGLGVSNAGLVQARGHQWEPPVKKLSDYVTAVPPPEIAVPGDHELEIRGGTRPEDARSITTDSMRRSEYLSADSRTHGADQKADYYNCSKCAQALMCLPGQDPQEARALGRRALLSMSGSITTTVLGANSDSTTTISPTAASDRLIDSLVAWGDSSRIASRLDEHRDAGATEIVVIPLNPGGGPEPHVQLLEALT